MSEDTFVSDIPLPIKYFLTLDSILLIELRASFVSKMMPFDSIDLSRPALHFDSRLFKIKSATVIKANVL